MKRLHERFDEMMEINERITAIYLENGGDLERRPMFDVLYETSGDALTLWTRYTEALLKDWTALVKAVECLGMGMFTVNVGFAGEIWVYHVEDEDKVVKRSTQISAAPKEMYR